MFRDKIRPLTKDEFERLEQNILKDGKVREPIITWKDTIIDGHNRYSICQKHPEIPFTVEEKDFADEYEAIKWMCENQLGRRNLTDAERKDLIGTSYEARQKTIGGQLGHPNYNAKVELAKSANSTLEKDNSSTNSMTRKIMAEELGTNEHAIRTAVEFHRGLEAGESVNPGFKEKVLTGQIKPTQKAVSDLRKAEPEERKQMVEDIMNPKPKTEKQIRKAINKAYEGIHAISGNKDTDPEVMKNSLEGVEGTFISAVRDYLQIYKNIIPNNKDKVLVVFEGLEYDIKMIIKEYNLK